MTLLMSTSLKVVSSAHSWVAVTRRSAILRRSGLIFLRVSRVAVALPGVIVGAAAGVLFGAGAVAVAAGTAAAVRMSDLVTRPSLPEPAIVATLTPVSSAALRAAGESGCCAPPPVSHPPWRPWPFVRPSAEDKRGATRGRRTARARARTILASRSFSAASTLARNSVPGILRAGAPALDNGGTVSRRADALPGHKLNQALLVRYLVVHGSAQRVKDAHSHAPEVSCAQCACRP